MWVLAAAVLWGTTGAAAHYAPDEASPLSIGAARIVGGGLLLVLLAARGRAQPSPAVPGAIGGRARAALLALGTAAVAGYQLCFFSAVDRTGVAVGTVVAIGSAPVLTGVLARALLGTGLSARWWAATALAIGGAGVLVEGGADGAVDTAGVALALGAGLAYACYALAASTLIRRGADSTRVMAAMFGGAGALLIPVLLGGDPGWLLGWRGALVAAWLALAATAAAYVLYGRGLRTTPPATAATLSLAEPAVAAGLGLTVLGEPASWATAVGLALIGAGLTVLTVRRRRTRQHAPGPRDCNICLP